MVKNLENIKSKVFHNNLKLKQIKTFEVLTKLDN